jgi:hypothetical protein
MNRKALRQSAIVLAVFVTFVAGTDYAIVHVMGGIIAKLTTTNVHTANDLYQRS